jgi:hypothetical protein
VSTVWIVSMVVAWLVIGGLCLVVLALVRQVGALTLRLDAAEAPEEPALYAEVAEQRSGSALLAVALDQDCATCAELEPAVADLAARVEGSVLVAGSVPSASVPVEDVPVLAAGRGTPRAVALTADGVVAAVGHPRSADDLQAMLHAARHAVLSAGPGARREHSWGVSVPYWEQPPAASEQEEDVVRAGRR